MRTRTVVPLVIVVTALVGVCALSGCGSGTPSATPIVTAVVSPSPTGTQRQGDGSRIAGSPRLHRRLFRAPQAGKGDL